MRTNPVRNELTEFLNGVTDPFVVMGVGVPGTGKSQELRRMSAELGIAVTSPLIVRRQLEKRGLRSMKRVPEIMNEQIADFLQSGQPVIIDGNHIDPRVPSERHEPYTRDHLTAHYRGMGARAVLALVFDHPLHEILGNYDKGPKRYGLRDINFMHRSLQARPVKLDEGFDLIAKQASMNQPVRIVDVARPTN